MTGANMKQPESAAGITPGNPLDVAIVGGGVSGLYAAWRLATCPAGESPQLDQLTARRRGPLRVALFEMSRRLGGRLLTLTPPGAPGLIVELGGMRYLPTQPLVTRLAEKDLALAHEDFTVDDRNVAYPRFQLAGGSLAADGAECPSQENVLLDAVRGIVGRDIAGLTAAERVQVQQEGSWGGLHLSDWGFLDLLNRVLSPADYSLVTGPSGLASQTGNRNAADAIFSLMSSLDPEATPRRPVRGMQEIPRRLAHLLRSHGGSISLNRELTGCSVESPTLVRLVFRAQPGQAGHPPLELPPVYARHLVLAMPRRALERIIEHGAADVLANPAVRSMIAAVTPVPAFHLACCYHEPWWERAGAGGAGQRGVSGLPLRQALYLGRTSGSTRPGQAFRRDPLILLTSDEQTIGYWTGLLRADGMSANPHRGDRWADYQAPEAIINEARLLLRKIHGTGGDATCPDTPWAAAMSDWSADPYGGQCHVWKTHERSRQLSDAIVQPVPDAPVHICGEAYSHQQGWVEGALNQAEHLLGKVFGVPGQ
jgi:lysine 2-monooxygenase